MRMIRLFLKFTGYILLKWFFFYAYQLIEGGSMGDWWGKSTNKEGILLAFFMLFALPVLEIIILFFPIHFALRQKGWFAIIVLLVSFSLEFLIGFYATNQHLETWMIIKIFLSISIFYIIYRKQLSFKV